MNSRIEACARRLVDVRRSGGMLEELPDLLASTSLNDAYSIQSQGIRLWPDEVVGWKVGATSKEVQSVFGISQPVYGPVFKKNVFQSPVSLDVAAFQHRMVEAEFAFRFGDDLPSRKKPYTRDEIVAAIDAVIPSIEIISPRLKTLTTSHISTVIADFCANGGAVLGRGRNDWRHLDLVSHFVTLSLDGVRCREGSGALVLGNPLNAVEWLVNALGEHGASIKKDQFILAGTMTGINAAEVNSLCRADFGDLGTVDLVFEMQSDGFQG